MKPYNTKQELEEAVLKDISRLKEQLFDSPISLKSQLDKLQGVYVGYCGAMEWEYNNDLINRFES